MPKGYVIFTEDIRDDAGISAYARQAVPTITQAGGRILVVDDAPELIEGPGTASAPSFWSSTPWKPRGTGTGRLNTKESRVSGTPPRTAT